MKYLFLAPVVAASIVTVFGWSMWTLAQDLLSTESPSNPYEGMDEP